MLHPNFMPLTERQYLSYFERAGVDPDVVHVFNLGAVGAAIDKAFKMYPIIAPTEYARLINAKTGSAQEIKINEATVIVYSQEGRLFRVNFETGRIGFERLFTDLERGEAYGFKGWDNIWVMSYDEFLTASMADEIMNAQVPLPEQEVLEILTATRESSFQVQDVWNRSVRIIPAENPVTELKATALTQLGEAFLDLRFSYRGRNSGPSQQTPKGAAYKLAQEVFAQLGVAASNYTEPLREQTFALREKAPYTSSGAGQCSPASPAANWPRREHAIIALADEIETAFSQMVDWCRSHVEYENIVIARLLTGNQIALIHYPIDYRIVHYEYYFSNALEQSDD